MTEYSNIDAMRTACRSFGMTEHGERYTDENWEVTLYSDGWKLRYTGESIGPVCDKTGRTVTQLLQALMRRS